MPPMVGLVVVQHGDEAADISAVTAAQQLAKEFATGISDYLYPIWIGRTNVPPAGGKVM
jgi:hypothetical protein